MDFQSQQRHRVQSKSGDVPLLVAAGGGLVVSHADWESVGQSLTAQSHDPDKNVNQIIEQSLMGS